MTAGQPVRLLQRRRRFHGIEAKLDSAVEVRMETPALNPKRLSVQWELVRSKKVTSKGVKDSKGVNMKV